MIEIKQVSIDDMLADKTRLFALFAEHWEEVALNKSVMVIEPDMAAYNTLADTGRLLLLAAYDGHELVGYSVNVVMPHPHYAGCIMCNNDLLFVAKEYRHGRVGLQLIRATEAAGKERGAKLMLWHAKENTALATMMPKLGYRVQDIIFSREV